MALPGLGKTTTAWVMIVLQFLQFLHGSQWQLSRWAFSFLACAPHKQAQGKRAAVVLANSDTVAQEGSTSLLCCAPAAAAPGTSAAAQAVTTQLKPPLQRAASNHSGWKYRSEHPWIPPWPTGPCPAAGTGARRCVLSLGPPPARPPSAGRESEKKKESSSSSTSPSCKSFFFLCGNCWPDGFPSTPHIHPSHTTHHPSRPDLYSKDPHLHCSCLLAQWVSR